MEVLDWSDLARHEFFPNVFGRVLVNGERMTFFLVEIPTGKKVPLHSHPHEQIGICLAGEAEFVSGKEKKTVRKGMVYRMKPNEEHEVRVTGSENGLFLDVFSPPRFEYVSKQRSIEENQLRKA